MTYQKVHVYVYKSYIQRLGEYLLLHSLSDLF